MSQLAQRFEQASAEDRVRWDGARTDRALAGLRLRRRRRTVVRTTMGTVLALALVVVALREVRGRSIASKVAPVESAPEMAAVPSRTVQLEDGSRATLFADAAIAFPASAAGVTAVQLVSGLAKFEVAHDERRVFRVLAGEVVIEDIGTAFTVESDGCDGAGDRRARARERHVGGSTRGARGR